MPWASASQRCPSTSASSGRRGSWPSVPDGTRRLHRVDLDGLTGLRAWVDRFWDEALDAFVAHAEGGERS